MVIGLLVFLAATPQSVAFTSWSSGGFFFSHSHVATQKQQKQQQGQQHQEIRSLDSSLKTWIWALVGNAPNCLLSKNGFILQ